MKNLNSIKTDIDEFLLAKINSFWERVPFAKHLIDKTIKMNERYYLRHRIETVKRINLTSRIDALALAAMINEDYELARLWGKYTIQEMNHDKMFLKDLQAHGITKQFTETFELFAATKKLITFLESQLITVGPIAAVAYSLFVEWNSDRYSQIVVEKAANQFSKCHVKGSSAHIKFDEHHDHYMTILKIAVGLLSKEPDLSKLYNLLDNLTQLFSEYFEELYNYTYKNVATNETENLIDLCA